MSRDKNEWWRLQTRYELLAGSRHPGQSPDGGPSRLLELLWLDDADYEDRDLDESKTVASVWARLWSRFWG